MTAQVLRPKWPASVIDQAKRQISPGRELDGRRGMPPDESGADAQNAGDTYEGKN
jgi:hypothetical protein